MSEDIGLGELSRSVANALVRIEGVAARLESGQFVRSDVYDLQMKSIQASLDTLIKNSVTTEAHTEAKNRIQKLEEANTWLVRIIISFVVVAVLTFVFSQTGGAK